jgi:S-adenosylmethionine synthetase
MNMENKRDHFEWSVNETVLNFKKEEIHVNVSKDFISKLFDIFNMYYYSLKKNRNTVEDLKIRYTNIFNSSISKTPAQIEETVFYVRLFTSHMGNSF